MEDSVNLLNGSKFCTILQQASIETFHLAKKIGSFVVEKNVSLHLIFQEEPIKFTLKSYKTTTALLLEGLYDPTCW